MNNKTFKKGSFILGFVFFLSLIFSSFSSNLTFAVTGDGSWASPYSVAQANITQNNTLKSVQGYIVGQPTATTTVITSGYVNDYSIALADSATETNTSNMIYVQVKTDSRSIFGLQTNPSLKGSLIKVTGYLTAYFSHSGVKTVTEMAKVAQAIAVTGVTLDKTSVSLAKGTTQTLTATVAPATATNKAVSWSSSNSTVASVVNGVITGNAAGSATITVKTADGGKLAICNVTVTSNTSIAVTGVTLDKTSVSLAKGTSQALIATVAPSTATNKAVSWTSSNTTVATVVNGTVTASGIVTGTADITVTTADGAKTAVCYVTVTSGSSSPYDSTYYASAIGKTGANLKAILNDVISNNAKISYDAVWDALRYTDEDPNNTNNVILLYTGRSQSKLTNGGDVNDWNREHVFAKSHGDFGTVTGPGTDLHHLRPTDVSVNSARGNLDFDMGGIPNIEATLCKSDSDSWEPRDSVKGDIARMLFYMATRYEGENGDVNLELNNLTSNTTAPYMGKLSTLLLWNAQDPVDTFERKRNDVIYNKYQHNRNPFIDHPEWVNLIWN